MERMIVTVAQAANLSCPMARPGLGRCAGAGCMAWKFERPLEVRVVTADEFACVTEPERPVHVPLTYIWCPYEPGDVDVACWVEPEFAAHARRTGYCGMVP